MPSRLLSRLAFAKPLRIMLAVRRLRTVVSLLLALMWLPATVHCRLESLPGFDFLTCCTHTDADQSTSHHEGDCQTDGCATVEAGLYKHEDLDNTPVKPMVAVSLLPVLLEELQARVPTSTGIRSPAPPELCCNWQFSYRAALPPRAPSFVL